MSKDKLIYQIPVLQCVEKPKRTACTSGTGNVAPPAGCSNGPSINSGDPVPPAECGTGDSHGAVPDGCDTGGDTAGNDCNEGSNAGESACTGGSGAGSCSGGSAA